MSELPILSDGAARGGPPPRAGETRCANSIFQQPWWLDAVAPGRWSEVVVGQNGQPVARLPYVVRGRGRLRMLTQPPLTQTLGPWLEHVDGKPANVLGTEIELLTALEAGLPRAHAFRQDFSPTLLNALPFHWAGYRIEVLYTYRLEGIQSETELWDDLRGNIRREIRKARKRVVVRDDLGLDRFHAVWSKTFERQGLEPPCTLAHLERIDTACAAHDARSMLFAVDEHDRIHAVTYVVWDPSAAYYLLGGGDAELRTSGASSLLMWAAIERSRQVTDVFDFEGSMLKPVERFFRAFGARQVPYLRVSRFSAPAHAAQIVRAASQRIAARRR